METLPLSSKAICLRKQPQQRWPVPLFTRCAETEERHRELCLSLPF